MRTIEVCLERSGWAYLTIEVPDDAGPHDIADIAWLEVTDDDFLDDYDLKVIREVEEG